MARTESLLDRTMRLLRKHRATLSLREIAEKVGLDRDYLKALLAGKIADPGILKIQRLHDWLDIYDRLSAAERANVAASEERAPAA